MACTCSNPKCPDARQYNACRHCMCLMQPDFGLNQVIAYAGPISRVCCKCSYAVQVGGTAR